MKTEQLLKAKKYFFYFILPLFCNLTRIIMIKRFKYIRINNKYFNYKNVSWSEEHQFKLFSVLRVELIDYFNYFFSDPALDSFNAAEIRPVLSEQKLEAFRIDLSLLVAD